MNRINTRDLFELIVDKGFTSEAEILNNGYYFENLHELIEKLIADDYLTFTGTNVIGYTFTVNKD